MRLAAFSVLVFLVVACGDAEVTSSPDECAHVVAVSVNAVGDRYRVEATVRSVDSGWEKYADAWEVRAPDGKVLGVRRLAHPHVDEQPFTRALDIVEIPRGVNTVTVAAHDSVLGFCGATASAPVPGR